MVSGVVTSPVASDISPYFRGYTTDPDTNDVMSSFALAINSSGRWPEKSKPWAGKVIGGAPSVPAMTRTFTTRRPMP